MKKLLLTYLRIFVYSLYTVIIVAGLAVAVLLLMGMKLYCIQTGSMEPQYPVGSMIAVEHVDFDSLREDDVITFVKSGDVVVTHRVVRIDKENQMLYTKGDNNNVDDATPVAYKNVIGRVRFKVPYFGWVILFLDTTFGKIMLGIVAFGLFGIAFIRRMYYKSLDEESDDEEEDGQNKKEDSGDEGDGASAAYMESGKVLPEKTESDSSKESSEGLETASEENILK